MARPRAGAAPHPVTHNSRPTATITHNMDEPQVVSSVWFTVGEGVQEATPLGEVPPVVVSEVLYDLTMLGARLPR